MAEPRIEKADAPRSERVTVTPVLVAELLADGERMPVYVHVVDHPDGRVLVDTGLTQLHPEVWLSHEPEPWRPTGGDGSSPAGG